LGFQNSLLLLDQPQKPLPECILIHQTINAAFFEDDESPFRVSVKTGPDHDGLAACFEGRFQTCPMELLTLATEQPAGIRIQTNLDRGLIRPYHTFPFSVLPISVCFTENTTVFPVGLGRRASLLACVSECPFPEAIYELSACEFRGWQTMSPGSASDLCAPIW